MAELKCKIKQLLKDNQIGLDGHFVEFMGHDENLVQLSKLIQCLKMQNNHRLEITEPLAQPIQNQEHLVDSDSVEVQATASLNVSQSHFSQNQVADYAQDQPQHTTGFNLLNAQPLDQIEPSVLDEDQQAVFNLQDVKLSSDLSHVEMLVNLDIASNNIDLENSNLKNSNLENSGLENNDLESSDLEKDYLKSDTLDSTFLDHPLHQKNKLSTELSPEQNKQVLPQKPAEIKQAQNSMFNNDVKFQVDNARAGQPYSSKITVTSNHDSALIQYKPESFKFSRENFQFDTSTQTIQGQPEIAEELTFSFQYYIDNETRTAQCKMNVIADPRSLWKVLEPETGQLYAKPHTDQALMVFEDYRLIAASRRGRSHEHGGTFRDDDFGLLQIENSPWSVLVTADGAGSASYSREGSRIAVEIVKSEFSRYLTGTTIESLNADVARWEIGSQDAGTQAIATKLNQQFYHVYYEIYKSIINQIEQQANELGIAAKLFSTTLLVAVVYSQPDKNFISTFSVGDGAIAVYNESHVRIMNVADGGEYAGQTKFLDRSIAQEFGSRVKIGCFDAIDAVIVMTDGISDPIFETDVGLAKHEKWKNLYRELNPLMQTDVADTALLEWMHFFTPGHHDDRTMAMLWKKNAAKVS